MTTGVPTVSKVKALRRLDDAIFMAALALERRDRSRRRMLFVISNGLDHGSDATPRDVQRALITGQISVYSLEIGDWSDHFYKHFKRLPGLNGGGKGLMERYVAATGGVSFTSTGRNSLEDAYSFLASQERFRYTLGYVPPHSAPGELRKISVTVQRPGLKVISRTGYYSGASAATSAPSK